MIGRHVGLSHPGRRRRRNEDSFVVSPPLFAVADGMGGARAGEIASRLAAAAVREEEGEHANVGELIREANRRVFERARDDAAASGMGTTMTLALVEDDHVTIGHVGDSRAYRLRDDGLEQLTEDHSLVAELVRSGRLSPEEAEMHPQRSVITRALGTEANVDVDTFTVETQPGDVFLLCSDGLTTMVGDERIVAAVRENREDLERAAKQLISDANRSGGEDNVTVVFFEIVEDGAEAGETAPLPAVVAEDEDTLTEAEDVPVVETVEEKRRLPLAAVVPVVIVLAAIAIVVLLVLMDVL
jgi:serine/threonine protein phosphatase PrpC